MMWGYGYGPGWGMGSWGVLGPIFMIFWLIVIVAIIVAVIWLARSALYHEAKSSRSSALDILDERYARGEINHDEYLEKKQHITG